MELRRVGWGFISLYTLAFMSTSLVFLAPLLVTLALKVNSLVGIEQAPNSLSVVTGTGALLALVGNPFFNALLAALVAGPSGPGPATCYEDEGMKEYDSRDGIPHAVGRYLAVGAASPPDAWSLSDRAFSRRAAS